uniref:Reverse transcriptase domain-containing protein n=1 Tax=Lactuca sativa TaxID=4236 RepID=A0A9R1VMD0_LACSA|nr:hypothetical protein LSAT_V11C400195770 [Lactuca sativa]
MNMHVVAHSSSYANVLKGQGAVKPNKGLVPECILQGHEIYNPLSSIVSVFGKLRDIRMIPKLGILLKEEGFPEIVIKRVILLELVGLACCAWNDVAVKKSASMWGEVCFIEEDEDAPLAVKQVAYFDDDVNDFIDVENGDKVDEGQENSFSMDNTPTNGVRGFGFVDRKGRFFQTNSKRKDDGVVDRSSCLPNVSVTRGVVENKCNLVKPSTDMESELQGDSPYLVDNVEWEGVAESPSQPLGCRRHQSSTSYRSSKILRKKVPVVVDDIEDVLKKYFEMGGLIGWINEVPFFKYMWNHSFLKRNWVKALCLQFGVSFLGSQETRMTQVDLFKIKSMWGNYRFGFASSSARGRPGGILSVWDTNVLTKTSVTCTSNVVTVGGLWIPFNINCFMVNIYAPRDLVGKQHLWGYLSALMRRNGGNYVLFGDFNVVREASERLGSIFCSTFAQYFNGFIEYDGRINVPMVGKRFTRFDAIGAKISKLDQFLVSNAVYDCFDHLQVLVLDWKWSDRCPILLHSNMVNFGPSPFKFFNSWLSLEGFADVVKGVMADFVSDSSWSKFVVFKNKLKYHAGAFPRSSLVPETHTQQLIRSWNAETKSAVYLSSNQLLGRFVEIDNFIDDGEESDDHIRERRGILGYLANLEEVRSLDVAQKVKSTWVVEGDENFAFFHALLKKRRRQLMIKGVTIDGKWISEPASIKMAFFDFYAAYDSVSWEYLDKVMGFLGFGDKWRAWIRGLCSNARSSMLINGSHTDEFHLFRGLRPGDHISLFLFIIVMEGLHIALEDAVVEGVFRGAPVGSNECSVADQVWSRVRHWLHLDLPVFSSICDIMDWVDSRLTAHTERPIVELVFIYL